MSRKTKRAVSGLMALAAAGGLTAGIADAAKSKHQGAKKGDRANGNWGHRFGDRGAHGRPPFRDGPPAALTGSDATKAKAAALDAVPGGTVRRAFKADGARDPKVAFAVMVQNAAGKPVLVLLDADFKLVRKLAGPRRGGPDGPHGGPGGPHGGPPNEAELTGDDAKKATAAAEAAVSGGTVWRASQEDPAENADAVYEVHVRKADGTEVEVLLDADFKVVRTTDWTGPGPGRGGRGHGEHGADFPGGPPPGAPPADSA